MVAKEYVGTTQRNSSYSLNRDQGSFIVVGTDRDGNSVAMAILVLCCCWEKRGGFHLPGGTAVLMKGVPAPPERRSSLWASKRLQLLQPIFGFMMKSGSQSLQGVVRRLEECESHPPAAMRYQKYQKLSSLPSPLSLWRKAVVELHRGRGCDPSWEALI